MECIKSPPCMKHHSFIVACLLGICSIASSLAATTVRYPSSVPSHLATGQPFQLVFDKAVVASSEVGKPLKPGLLSVSPEFGIFFRIRRFSHIIQSSGKLLRSRRVFFWRISASMRLRAFRSPPPPCSVPPAEAERAAAPKAWSRSTFSR